MIRSQGGCRRKALQGGQDAGQGGAGLLVVRVLDAGAGWRQAAQWGPTG
mgnify:FL=1